MSSEFTIDIQLTELGFPDILKPPGAHVTEPSVLASSCASFSHNRTPSILSNTSGEKHPVKCNLSVHKGQQVTGVSQINDIQEITAVYGLASALTSPCTTPTQSLQEKQADSLCSIEAVQGSVFPLLAKSLTISSNNRLSQSTGQGQGASEILPRTSEQKNWGIKTENGITVVELEPDDNSTEVYNSEETDDTEEEEEQKEEVEMEEDMGQDDEPRSSGEYHCDVCELLMPSKRDMQDHMNLHTGARPYLCVECGKRFHQMSNYLAHLHAHSQSKLDAFHCRICQKQFESEEGLKSHLSTTHFEEKFYECDLCKRIFTNLKRCQRHVEWHKCTLGKFQCERCGRTFSSAYNLKCHLKNRKCKRRINDIKAHRKKRKRSYNCAECPKSFASKNSLLKHSFYHLGLLPYTCKRCQLHFRLVKLYWKHKCEPQSIHCVACLKVFDSKMDFEMHKKDTGCWGNQEPEGHKIRCLECGEIFPTSEQLRSHAGAHQRVLSCAECGKGFRSALLLMSHMGGHASQRPCLCQNCGLGFPHQQSYDIHLKTCGKLPLSTSGLKKHPTSNGSRPPEKPTLMLAEKLPLLVTLPMNAYTTVTVHNDDINLPAAPVNELFIQGHVTEGMSGGSGPEDDKISCLECGQKFSTPNQLKIHIGVHHRVLSCAECGKGFRSVLRLISHMGSHASQAPFICHNCGLCFPDQQGYDGHLDTCGDIPASVSTLKKCRASNSTQPPMISTPQPTEKNPLPATAPTNGSNLAHTTVTVHSDVTNTATAPVKDLISQAHVTEGLSGGSGPQDDQIHCLKCGQSFATPEQLKSHASVHQMGLTCTECGKEFPSAMLLMSHMGCHAGQRPCLCHHCGLGFPHQQGYDAHLKTCGEISTSESALKKGPDPNISHSPIKSTPKLAEKFPHPATAPTNGPNLAHTTIIVHSNVSNIPAAQVKDLVSQGHVREGISGGSVQSEGASQLTPDKLPPSLLNLVLFVPVPPEVPQILPAADARVKRPVALLPVPKAERELHLQEAASYVSENSASGAQPHIDSPRDLLSIRKQDPTRIVALDLSKNSTSPLSFLTEEPSVKREPEDPTFSDVKIETFPRFDCVEQVIKSLKNIPERDSTSPGLTAHIKEEPVSPGHDFHMVSFGSCVLTIESPEKEIKIEVDESSPAYTESKPLGRP